MFYQDYSNIDRLVLSAQSGDMESVAELMDFYAPLIRSSLRRCCLRDARLTAYREDLESDVFLIFHHLIEKYNPELSFFSRYLAQRLDFALLSAARVYIGVPSSIQSAETFISDFSEMASPPAEDPFLRIHNQMALEAAIAALSPAMAEAVRMYYYEDFTQVFAAAAVGITQAAFSKRLSRALKNIRAFLGEDF